MCVNELKIGWYKWCINEQNQFSPLVVRCFCAEMLSPFAGLMLVFKKVNENSIILKQKQLKPCHLNTHS